jgi:hypothetical protein
MQVDATPLSRTVPSDYHIDFFNLNPKSRGTENCMMSAMGLIQVHKLDKLARI